MLTRQSPTILGGIFSNHFWKTFTNHFGKTLTNRFDSTIILQHAYCALFDSYQILHYYRVTSFAARENSWKRRMMCPRFCIDEFTIFTCLLQKPLCYLEWHTTVEPWKFDEATSYIVHILAYDNDNGTLPSTDFRGLVSHWTLPSTELNLGFLQSTNLGFYNLWQFITQRVLPPRRINPSCILLQLVVGIFKIAGSSQALSIYSKNKQWEAILTAVPAMVHREPLCSRVSLTLDSSHQLCTV